MAVVSTGLTTGGLRSEFLARFDATNKIYEQVSTRIQSTTKLEQYRWLGNVPQMREWGTGRIEKGLRTESYDVENLKYESTIAVDRDEISDDQTGSIRIRIQEMAAAAATYPDFLLANLLVNGGAAGFVSYDDKTFFASDHESGASGAQDNTLAATAADTADVTVAEFKKSLKDAIELQMTLKSDTGVSLRLDPRGLVVMVPAQLYFTALEAISATMISSTDNVLKGAGDVIVLPDLTDGTKWYLLKTDDPVRPFIFQDREPIEFKSLAENSESEFLREVYLYGVRARYRLTYGYWTHAIEITFS